MFKTNRSIFVACWTVLSCGIMFFMGAQSDVVAKSPRLTAHRLLKRTPIKGIDIQKVMDYKMPQVIDRYCKDYNIDPATAKVHERELKRYFILTSEYKGNLAMLSKEVDNLWHTFLLFTKEYQQFCYTMFGEFKHHVPKVSKTDLI